MNEAELSQLSNDATQGRWGVFNYLRNAFEIGKEDNYATGCVGQLDNKANAHFVVAAVNYVREMLASKDTTTDLLTFSQALNEIKLGYKAKRVAWKGRSKYVILKKSSDPLEMSYLQLVYDDGSSAPWTATRCDLVEEDWVVITNEEQ